jgi:hypothetical protein
MTPAETLSNAARLMRERPEAWVAAVADWLDSRALDAADAVFADGVPGFRFCDDPPGIEAALKVAGAYLGGGDAA